jgi:hypothetical protein
LNPTPEPRRRIEASCPICATVVCPHGICRSCQACEVCVIHVLPATPAIVRPLFVHQVRLATHVLSRERRHIEERADYLAGIGLASGDWADASRALDELKSDACVCGNRKRPYDPFCPDCHNLLPSDLRPLLKRHLGQGYLDPIRRAWSFLAAERYARQHSPTDTPSKSNPNLQH